MRMFNVFVIHLMTIFFQLRAVAGRGLWRVCHFMSVRRPRVPLAVRLVFLQGALALRPVAGGANLLYPIFKQRLLDKAIDMDTDTIKADLCDSAEVTYNAAHDDHADITGAGIVSTATLGTLTIALGVFDSADFSWTAVTGDQSEVILLWDDTHASDALIAFYDTGITGMPVTPNGGNINVTVNASGWFSL